MNQNQRDAMVPRVPLRSTFFEKRVSARSTFTDEDGEKKAASAKGNLPLISQGDISKLVSKVSGSEEAKIVHPDVYAALQGASELWMDHWLETARYNAINLKQVYPRSRLKREKPKEKENAVPGGGPAVVPAPEGTLVEKSSLLKKRKTGQPVPVVPAISATVAPPRVACASATAIVASAAAFALAAKSASESTVAAKAAPASASASGLAGAPTSPASPKKTSPAKKRKTSPAVKRKTGPAAKRETGRIVKRETASAAKRKTSPAEKEKET